MADLARVLAFIEENVEDELPGERLSDLAGLSRFHFQRRFAKQFGLGPRAYVEQVRLRRAAYRLAFRPAERILDIALDSGFGCHESFSRAFKRAVGQTPSQFRHAPRWDEWIARAQPLAELRRRYLHTAPSTVAVRILDCPSTPVIGLRHRAEREPLLATVQRFIAWRKRHHLSPRITPTFNLFRRGGDGSERGDAVEISFCVGTARRVPLEPDMFTAALPGGRSAVLRHVGDEVSLGTTARWLATDWLAASAHTLRAAPFVFQRLAFFPDVPEREAVTDLILPLA